MRNNPQDWRIEDLEVLARHFGIAHRQQGTSQVTFRQRAGGILAVPAARPIKPIYIRRFLAMIDAIKDAR
jgi:hypothetical protein